MSSASASKASEPASAPRLRLWPQSLLGRLIAATVLAVLIAQAVGLVLIAEERENFVLQSSVREWTRRISETVQMLAPLAAEERATAVAQLPGPRGAPPSLPPPPADDPPRAARNLLDRGRTFVRLPVLSDFERTLREQVQAALGSGYEVTVGRTLDASRPAIALPVPFYEARELAAHRDSALRYDVGVRFPDGGTELFRVTRMPGGAPLPRNLRFNLTLLLVVLVIALFVTARSITRPLSALARAADSIGRDARPEKLPEAGARELRDAARAFNTMQDRLNRYLDSRARVLAAMSHDLKTPLTRLRLQAETLGDAALQARIVKELTEMELMVREALSLFRGLDDGEPAVPVEVNELVESVRQAFAEMGAAVSVSGRALAPFTAKAQALKRCLTNLISNAVNFGTRADVRLEDNGELVIRVRDAGPGVPPGELEQVFEPFYRLEHSRNRDSGGTGLGLTIARDIAQAHGGTLILANLPEGGLEATLRLPRRH
ncbi:MAG TPA: ATP-binding protein [Steroidobacteraceae bacterium]|nr:ATP-binding protein [Steroidobacteraceae bacterium]